MKRTTVKIPDDLDAKLRHEAERMGMTVSEVVRQALEMRLGGSRRPILRSLAGSLRSGDGNLARRIDEIIQEDIEAGRFP
ncbi:MAG: ribbon-helix-helix domain-containing protein [Actinomycetota bacterium]|nr:ribbon-helix-helix domain-containing protein [Actinomycetota bacterium]